MPLHVIDFKFRSKTENTSMKPNESRRTILTHTPTPHKLELTAIKPRSKLVISSFPALTTHSIDTHMYAQEEDDGKNTRAHIKNERFYKKT